MDEVDEYTSLKFMQELKIRDNTRHCEEHDVDPLERDDYQYYTYLTLMCLCCATILVLIYINYKVIKIVKTKDKVLVAMLVCLKLSLFWDAVFFG